MSICVAPIATASAGTDPVDFASGESIGIAYRGPGGAVLNYTETTFSGQRATMKMVASGALDRHPGLIT